MVHVCQEYQLVGPHVQLLWAGEFEDRCKFAHLGVLDHFSQVPMWQLEGLLQLVLWDHSVVFEDQEILDELLMENLL